MRQQGAESGRIAWRNVMRSTEARFRSQATTFIDLGQVPRRVGNLKSAAQRCLQHRSPRLPDSIMRTFLCLLLSCLATFAYANEEAMKRFNYLMGDETLRQQAFEAGRERALFCGYCHGENGNSKRPHIPNLASQNPIYLFHSFEKFASGERTDFVMSKLAKSLTLEDRVNVAVYFSQQKVLASDAPVDPALSKQGAAVFQRVCTGCHGARAQGMETMPRLAGQPEEYIRTALTRFRTNDPSRAGSVMIGIASQLSETEIGALAAYLSRLQLSPSEEQANLARLHKLAAQ